MIKLSLVVPCFNEEERFGKGAKAILSYLRKQKYSWELIFVNDGSKDKTLSLMKKFAALDKRVRVISYRNNQGKGYALKKGCLSANSEFIFFSDIDLSVPIKTLEFFWPYFKRGFDIAIGSRRVKGAKIVKHQFFLRELLGQGFTTFVRLLLVPGIDDVTCGFKGFKGAVGHNIFSRCRISRWAIDAEVLFLARKFRFKVIQVPVAWSNVPQTKVNLAKDVLLTFGEITKILTNNFLGRYQNVTRLE